MSKILAPLLGLVVILGPTLQSTGQMPAAPETVAVTSGGRTLRALLWRPTGRRPFPAILFNHGSYSAGDPISLNEPAALGPVFARHGYVFLFLFRQGIGLSTGQGTADGDVMARALAAEGLDGRNRAQLALLENEELNEALAGLAFLRTRHDVDPRRIGVAGHSFGGSLTLLLAARDTTLRAAVVFGAAAGSWAQSPALRQRLLAAVGQTQAPVLFLHAANDYSTASGEALAAEMERLRKPYGLRIYPAAGSTSREGHNFLYRNVATWERDVFDFLSPLGSAFAQSRAGAIPDVTKPPPIVHDAGGFRARRLDGAPAIDGREWIPVDVWNDPAPAALQAPDRQFSLTLADAGTDTGDFHRYRLLFQRGQAAPVRIDEGFTGWVYVTPDSRYIVTEPLYVLDVREWKQYALFDALGIANYTSIDAISRDGRRLLLSRRACEIDCRDERREDYELTLPIR